VPPHLYGQNGALLLEIHCFNVGNKPFWQLFRSLSHYNIIREQGVHPYDYMPSLLRGYFQWQSWSAHMRVENGEIESRKKKLEYHICKRLYKLMCKIVTAEN
jgi:hypothetical protein